MLSMFSFLNPLNPYSGQLHNATDDDDLPALVASGDLIRLRAALSAQQVDLRDVDKVGILRAPFVSSAMRYHFVPKARCARAVAMASNSIRTQFFWNYFN